MAPADCWVRAVHFAPIDADEKKKGCRSPSNVQTTNNRRGEKNKGNKGEGGVNQRSNCPTGRNGGEGRKNWVSLTGRCFSSDSQHTTENRYRSMEYTLRLLLLPPLVSPCSCCCCCCCCCCCYHTRAAVAILRSQSCVIFVGKRTFLRCCRQQQEHVSTAVENAASSVSSGYSEMNYF